MNCEPPVTGTKQCSRRKKVLNVLAFAEHGTKPTGCKVIAENALTYTHKNILDAKAD